MATINIDGSYFAFTCTSASATVGATYTNNSSTFTVQITLAAGTLLYAKRTSGTNDPSASGTLTYASGTGDATITFSAWTRTARIDGVTYAAGDDLSVYGFSTLLIDRTPATNFRQLNCTTAASSGIIRVENTSTSTPIVITTTAITGDITIQQPGSSLDVEGDWIQIATGTGAISQTIDFASVMSGLVDYPPCVWVEAPNQYWFTVTAANATVGDTYTNNGATFTVMTTIAGATTLYCSAFTGSPAASGTLTKAAGSGDATITFSSYQSVDNTRFVELTVGGVTSRYVPFHNCGKVADTLAIDILTHFYGDLQHGPVFQYDTGGTKVATFGKGGATGSSLGGCVIPNGAKVIYPNIHFTCASFDSTPANRPQIVPTAGANVSLSCVAFSRSMQPLITSATAGVLTVSDVAAIGMMRLAYGAAVVATNVVATPDTALSASTGYIQGILVGSPGELTIDYLWWMGKSSGNQYGVYIANVANISNIGTIWSYFYNTAGSGNYTVWIEKVFPVGDVPVQCGPVYAIGAPVYVLTASNIHIRGLYHSDRITNVQAGNSRSVLMLSAASLISCTPVRQIGPVSTAAGGRLISFDASTNQCAASDIVYSGRSNSAGIAQMGGSRNWLATADVPLIASTPLSYTNNSDYTRASNINPTTSGGTWVYNWTVMGQQVEWVHASSADITQSVTGYDNPPVLCIYPTITDRTTGALAIGPLAGERVFDLLEIVSGTDGVDFSLGTQAAYPGSGVELIWSLPQPIRAVTSFASATWTDTKTSWTGAAIEFAMRNNDDTSAWGSWYAADTVANWQTAFAALSGYDSDVGFWLRLRITTSTAVPARRWQYGRVSNVTLDGAWTPHEVGFVQVTVDNLVSSSCVKLYETLAGPTYLRVQCVKEAVTSRTFEFPYGFDGTAKAFRVRVRKPGYDEQIIDGSTYTRGATVPAAQVLRVAVDESAASAITGVSVDVATSTITLSEDHTIAEVYDYVQWWSAQIANIEYDIPLVTTDEVVYTSGYDWELDTGVTLTGDFTTTGTVTLTGTADIVGVYTSSGGTNTKLTLTGLSAAAVEIFDELGAHYAYTASVTGTYTLYLPHTETGTWSWKVAKYGYLAAEGTFAAGTGAVTAAPSLATDTGITQGTVATVIAYTDLLNLDRQYDYLAYWETTSTGIMFDRLAVKNGDSVDFGALNVTFDSTAVAMVTYAAPALTLKAGTVVVGSTFTEFETSGTFTLAGASTYAAPAIWTDSGGRHVYVTAANIVSGSRVQIYNVTNSVEVYNGALGGAGLSYGVVYTADKTFRLRADHADKLPLEVTGTLTRLGVTWLDSQDDDTVYTDNAIDGSTCTEFAADLPNIHIDVSDPDGETSVQRLYAWAQYYQTTSVGIASDFFGSVTAFDSVNYTIDETLADIKLDNIGGSPVRIIGGYLTRSDGSTIIAATSGSIQMDPGKAYLAGASSIADGVLAAEVWTGYSLKRTTRIIAAAVAGKVSGGPGSPVFRNLPDDADQVSGTADANGNRTAATYGA